MREQIVSLNEKCRELEGQLEISKKKVKFRETIIMELRRSAMMCQLANNFVE